MRKQEQKGKIKGGAVTEKIYLNRVAFGNLICYTIKIQAKEFINMRQGILK